LKEIMKLLPHRFPFLMVDKVIEVGEDHAVCLKHISFSDPVFMGHFPSFPVYPGVLILEGLAQTAGVMLLDPEQKAVPLFLGIDQARFKSMVRPGDTVVYNVRTIEKRGFAVRVEGKATVDDKLVARAILLVGVKTDEDESH